MKTKLAICDLDGTLFNTDSVNYLSYRAALNDYGYELTKQYFIDECNGKHYKHFLPYLVDENEDMVEKVHNRKKSLYNSNLKFAKMNVHLFNLIKAIKNDYFLSVVTSASRRNCEELLYGFNVFDLFDLVVTHDDVEKFKPDPEGFIKAMEYFKVAPQNTIIFEDSKIGVEAARKSGANLFIVSPF